MKGKNALFGKTCQSCLTTFCNVEQIFAFLVKKVGQGIDGELVRPQMTYKVFENKFNEVVQFLDQIGIHFETNFEVLHCILSRIRAAIRT